MFSFTEEMNKTSYVRRESWLQEVNRLTFLTDRILTDVPFKNITVIAEETNVLGLTSTSLSQEPMAVFLQSFTILC